MTSKLPSLRVVKRKDGWWILGDGEPIGPYDKKADADDDRYGLRAFYEMDAMETNEGTATEIL